MILSLKKKSMPIFILYLHLSVFLAVNQSISTFTQLVIFLWRLGEKLRLSMLPREQLCFHQLPVMERAWPGGLAACQLVQGLIHTLLQQVCLVVRYSALQSLLSPSWGANKYIQNWMPQVDGLNLNMFQLSLQKKWGVGRILIFSLPFFFFSVRSLCVYHKLDLLRMWCWATHMANTQLRNVEGKSLFCF